MLETIKTELAGVAQAVDARVVSAKPIDFNGNSPLSTGALPSLARLKFGDINNYETNQRLYLSSQTRDGWRDLTKQKP